MQTPPHSNSADKIVAIQLIETMLKYIKYDGFFAAGLNKTSFPNIVIHMTVNEARMPK